MAQRKLRTVLGDFLQSLQECRRLAADAYGWPSPGARGTRPLISQKRRDQMTEVAFLQAFLAWESFLEESFILYLVGQLPPRGRAPIRYVVPLNYKITINLVLEGRDYARWTSASDVSKRADRFFKDGRPFGPVLRSNRNTLDEVNTIRNAIAHRSGSAHEKFEILVRTKIKSLPPNLTVGGFLGTTWPGSTPPVSFLDFYVAKIDLAAQQIVPS